MNSNRADEAATALSAALAAIEEYSDYIPVETYNTIADAVTTWLSEAEWQSDPKLLRICAPHVLRRIFELRAPQ